MQRPNGERTLDSTPAAGPDWTWRATLAVGVLLTVGVVALHFVYYWHAGPLWRDEAGTAGFSAMPYGEIVAKRHYDAFPVAFTLIVHTWIAAGLGGTDAGLRQLGMLMGLAGVAALWWSGRRLRLAAPLVALLLFGMNPSRIIWGDSVRGYGLAIFAVLWCIGALWAFVERPTWRTYAIAQLAALLTVQSHYGNTALLAGMCAGAAAVCLRRRAWRSLALTMAIGGVAAIAVMINVAGMTSSHGFAMAATDTGDFSLGWYLGVFWRALTSGTPLLGFLWVGAAGLAAAGGLVAARSGSRSAAASKDLVLYVVTAVAVSTVVLFAVAWGVVKLPSQVWHYLPLMALIGLASDVGIGMLASRFRRGGVVRLAVVAVAAVLVARDVAATVSVRMTNIDLSARWIEAAGRAEDLIVVYPWFCSVSFDRYYRGPAPWITVPDVVDRRYHPLLEVAEKIKLGDAGFAAELERVEGVLRAGGRVWIVGGLLAPPPGQPAPHLPPAPNGPWGWQSAPYITGWLTQLGALMQAHARTLQKIELPPTGSVNDLENAPLLVAEGWH